MHTPWHNKTGIPKAIAILATTAILAFGLCTADMVIGPSYSDSKLANLLQFLPLLFGVTVVVCVIALGLMVDVNKRRAKRDNRRNRL